MQRVEEIYQNRERRARELRKEGKQIIGYFCCFPPLEIMTAAGLVPYRILGDVREPISQADAYLETQICAFVRSCFDIGLKGKYDFLDGLVVPHSCDAVYDIYRIWNFHLKPPYSHFIHVPHVPDHATSEAFFQRELERFKRSIEKLVGRQISTEQLRQAIELHNKNRALLRELNNLRKEERPLISGTQMLQTIIAVMSLPVTEANELVKSLTEEIKASPVVASGNQPRVFVYGSEIDDIAFMQLVEESGARVVMDDLSIGTRFYWHDVEMTEDPLNGLATRYLQKIMCPRTYREGKPRERFKYILEYIKDFKAQGAILYAHRFCDSHGLDIPDLTDLLREEGLPVIQLEDDYSLSSLAPLKTRVQAFLEMIS